MERETKTHSWEQRRGEQQQRWVLTIEVQRCSDTARNWDPLLLSAHRMGTVFNFEEIRNGHSTFLQIQIWNPPNNRNSSPAKNHHRGKTTGLPPAGDLSFIFLSIRPSFLLISAGDRMSYRHETKDQGVKWEIRGRCEDQVRRKLPSAYILKKTRCRIESVLDVIHRRIVCLIILLHQKRLWRKPFSHRLPHQTYNPKLSFRRMLPWLIPQFLRLCQIMRR